MERIATELALRLADTLEAFVRSTERLLHVRCDEHTAKLAQTVVSAISGRAPSTAIVLRSPAIGVEGEWGVRAIELTCWYAAAERERAARGEATLGALPRGLLARPDATSFAAVLGAVLARMPRGVPVVVVLAPHVAVRALDATALLSIARALPEHARLVCLEREPASRELESSRGTRTIDVRLDEAQVRRELAERFAAMAAAPVGASGARATGAAGPRVAPPPRPSALPPSAEARETRSRAGQARQKIAAFAAAMLRGDARAILATQEPASDSLAAMGAGRVASQLRIARASALATTGRLEDALRECAIVRDEAARAGDGETCVAAMSCAAGLLLGAGHRERARGLCLELADVAERAGQPLFAAHALRASAQIALRAGDTAAAASALDRVIAIGERAPAHEVLAGPFGAVVRDLAELCRAHGLVARALEAELRGRELTDRAQSALREPGSE